MIGKPYKMLSKIGYNGAMIIQHRFYALSDYIPYLKTNLHHGVLVKQTGGLPPVGRQETDHFYRILLCISY
jgi:hypothetical protein